MIYGRFSSEKHDFYAIVHNGYDGSAIWTNFQVIFLGSHAGYLVSTGAYVYLERILRDIIANTGALAELMFWGIKKIL